MRVLLIKAARHTRISISIIPPLGIMYLASTLRKTRGDDVRLHDCWVQSDADLAATLWEFRPDVVGISAMTLEAVHMHEIAAIVRKQAPAARIVAGGPHPTAYAETTLRDSNIDVAVLHEGEQTTVDLLQAFARNEPLGTVKGIAFRADDGALVRTPPRGYIEDLDALPHPAWDLIDYERYTRVKTMSLLGPRRSMPIFTSRSCPYRCTYCHDMFGKGFYSRSPENVLDEIRQLVRDYRVTDIEIVDDIFNIDRKRCRKILEMIRDSGIKVRISFPNGLRGDVLDKDTLQLFHDAGTRFIGFAIESATPRIQEEIRKHVRLDKLAENIAEAERLGIFTVGFFMLGFPGESEQEVAATIDFGCRLPLHTAYFNLVVPFEGTAMSRVAPIQHHDFDRYGLQDGNVNVSAVDDARLFRMMRLAYLRFFLSPPRIWRIVRHYPTGLRGLSMMFWLLLERVFVRNGDAKPAAERKLPSTAPTHTTAAPHPATA